MTESVQLVCFGVGEQNFACDVMDVVEVLAEAKVVPLPGAPSFCQGLLELRGEHIPVVDLRSRVSAAPQAAKRRWVVCQLDSGRVAYAVDEVSEVKVVGRNELSQAPVLLTIAGRSVPCKLYARDHTSFFVLNVTDFLSEAERAELGRSKTF